MGKISLYSTLTNPLGDDILIGTDIHDYSITKNFTIQSLFDIGLEISTSKINIFDATIHNYGHITLNNDVFKVEGAPLNSRNLLVSDALGFLSFKKDNFNAVFDATIITNDRIWDLPDYSGTVALVQTTDLQQVTTTGNVTTNDIKVNKLNLFDTTLADYAEVSVDDDVFKVKGSLPGTHNLLISDIAGFLSFKNGSFNATFDATAITNDRIWAFPDVTGTVALTNTMTLQQVTDNGNFTTNKIKVDSLDIFDPTLANYGNISLDDDVFKVKGSLPNLRNLLVSDAAGSLSFKKANFTLELDATAVTNDRAWVLPDEDGTILLEKYKVFTAIVSQSGTSSTLSVFGDESIVAGVTYYIQENPDLNDLSMYGAPNNSAGTLFVSNQSGPLPYTASLELTYDTGAPVAVVLENTIGNIFFTYDGVGNYSANSSSLFTTNKTVTFCTVSTDPGSPTWTSSRIGSQSIVSINKFNKDGDGIDGISNCSIEIRVYN